MKKPCEKPAIVCVEKNEWRATTCISGDEGCRIRGGPIQS
jgi:hypothetical protein